MPLKHHEETLNRMAEFGKRRYNFSQQTKEQREARERMALFPSGDNVEVIFTAEDMWVVRIIISSVYGCGVAHGMILAYN